MKKLNVNVKFQDETKRRWVNSGCLEVYKKALEYKRGDLTVYEDKVSIVLDGVYGNKMCITTLEGTYQTI